MGDWSPALGRAPAASAMRCGRSRLANQFSVSLRAERDNPVGRPEMMAFSPPSSGLPEGEIQRLRPEKINATSPGAHHGAAAHWCSRRWDSSTQNRGPGRHRRRRPPILRDSRCRSIGDPPCRLRPSCAGCMHRLAPHSVAEIETRCAAVGRCNSAGSDCGRLNLRIQS